jgi:DsbC/DsbD-like thiol-disulfide interchange protein
LVATVLIVAGLSAVSEAAGVSLASPWLQVHSARVRLVAGAPEAKSGTSYLAGVEVALDDGWKTYWRTPGDAGVPPMFDWAGSTNVRAVKVLYPAPMRMQEAAAQTIGYKTAVTFPVEVVPSDAGKPVDLKLKMELGICREICIPANVDLSLRLLPEHLQAAPSPDLMAALEKVPRPAASRRPTDPELTRMSAKLDGDSPHLTIDARFTKGDDKADLFVEAPEGIYVPLPTRLAKAPDGLVRFEVDLSRGGNAGDLKGKALTVTLVDASGASEATWTAP